MSKPDINVYLKCTAKGNGCQAMQGTHNRGDTYCWQCGQPLEKWVKECTECNITSNQANNYCVHCGKGLTERKLPWQETK